MNSFPWLQMLVTQFPTHDFDIFHLHFKFSNEASRTYALIKFHFNILNFSTNNKPLLSDNNWLITKFYWKDVKVAIFSKTCCLRLGFLSRVKPGKELDMNNVFGKVASREQVWGFKVREGSCVNQGLQRHNLLIYQSINRFILTN